MECSESGGSWNVPYWERNLGFVSGRCGGALETKMHGAGDHHLWFIDRIGEEP